jgi:hypothetical protein
VPGSAGAFLDEARSHLNYTEGAGNRTPFGKWAGADGAPWCHSFASYCLDRSGTPIGKITYCPTGVVYFRDRQRLFTVPQPGDLGYVYFPAKGRYAHVYGVESVDGDHVWTVEGNSNYAGSRTGGQVVRLRRRWKGTPTVFGRPAYATKSAPVGFKDDSGETIMEAFVMSRPQGGFITVQKDGGVFQDPDGRAPYKGSLPELGIVHGFPIVAGAWSPSGNGYWLIGRDGATFAFGDATPITGSNVDPLRSHVGARRVVGLVCADATHLRIVAAEKSGDFDVYEAAA